MRQKKAWEITDDFWEEVKDLLIRESGKQGKRINGSPAVEESRKILELFYRQYSTYYGQGYNGKRFLQNTARQVRYTAIFNSGARREYFCGCGNGVLVAMTSCEAYSGNGKA